MTAHLLAGLIARLEMATEGNRALDWEIHGRDGLEGIGSYWDCPRYTSDLNAALSLVPEHIECGKLQFSRNKTGRQYCHATLEQSAESLGRDMRDDEPLEIEAQNAATPALALCIAALRARTG